MKELEIWERDLMPSRDVVLDFYECCELTGGAEWEAIAEHDQLADHVPGFLKIAPHAQWRVTSGEHEWMIYQWWHGTGTDDDRYLYEPIK